MAEEILLREEVEGGIEEEWVEEDCNAHSMPDNSTLRIDIGISMGSLYLDLVFSISEFFSLNSDIPMLMLPVM